MNLVVVLIGVWFFSAFHFTLNDVVYETSQQIALVSIHSVWLCVLAMIASGLNYER